MLVSLRKCLVLLTPRERWRWAGMIPLLIATAVMEALGAAAVFGLIKIIANPAVVATLPVASTVFARLPWHEGKQVVLVATLAVATFYIIKNLLLGVITAIQGRVVTTSIAALSEEMLKGYLSVPFAFHFRRNSSELIRNITDSADQVFRLVLSSVAAAVSEAFIVVGIIVVLMITAPFVALVAVVVLFSLLALVLHVTRRVLVQWGEQEHSLKQGTLQTLQQTLGGLKEVKVQGREQFFYGIFSHQQRALLRVRFLSGTLSSLSRLLIETVFVCGMLLVIMLVAVRDNAGADIVPLLGLYAYAGFRIIPSVNRMLLYISYIRYGAAPVDALHQDFVAFTREPGAEWATSDDAGVAFAGDLVLDRVSYTYDGTDTPALRDVCLTIRQGESIGIVGPTGAGKSTLIDLVLGLLQPSSGRILVDGAVVLDRARPWQRRIGYVPQAVYLTDDTLRRNIAFGRSDEHIDEQKVETAARSAQLQDVIAALPQGLDTFVGERGVRLSGGERQRVAIARALYHQPELLVFDEATSALDNQTERELTRAIEALHGEKTLIIIAHRLSTVRNCDRLVFLRNGCVAGVGSFDELVAQNAEFRAMASVSPADS